MSVKKYSIKQIAEIVNNEGLGYAVQNYLGADEIKDKALATEWKKAKDSLDIIEGMLRDYLDW